MLLSFIKHLRNDAIEQTHTWKQECETVIKTHQVYLVYGLHSSNADFFFFFSCIEAPCLGLHLNLHDDPNMNEQKTNGTIDLTLLVALSFCCCSASIVYDAFFAFKSSKGQSNNPLNKPCF